MRGVGAQCAVCVATGAIMTDTQRCLVVSRHDKPPKAVPGLLVCPGHRAKVERMLAELPALYDDLGLVLVAPDGGAGEPVRTSRAPGLSLNHKVVAARDEIRGELVRITRHVCETRNFSAPRDDINAMATFLVANSDWLCAQPDADETHDYLDGLHRYATLAYPTGLRRFAIGAACKVPVACHTDTHDVLVCGGELEVVLMPNDDREDMSEIRCRSCGLEVPASGWLSWGDRWQRGAA